MVIARATVAALLASLVLSACVVGDGLGGTPGDDGSDGDTGSDTTGSGGGTGGGGGLPAGVIDVGLIGTGGYLYTAPITIGASTLQVQVDTGSTTLAVAGASCGSACIGITPLYAPGTGATDQHQTATTTYGDMSSWNGEIYQDHVAVGASQSVSVDFATITAQDQFFAFGNVYQGIIGMGPDGLLNAGTTSFKTAAFAAGMAPEMAFRMCGTTGDMWLGGVDASAMTSPPVYTPAVPITADQPFYAVNIASVGVGTTALATQSALGATLVDTGTGFTYLPAAAVTALTSTVAASAGYKQLFGTQAIDANDCPTAAGVTAAQIDAALPPMTISFPDANGGTSATLQLAPTRSYMYDNGGGSWCLDVLDNTDIGLSIMGDTLQASFVTVFDLANNRIGFAPEAGCSEASAARRDHVEFPPALPGMPWWSNNPNYREPRRRPPGQ